MNSQLQKIFSKETLDKFLLHLTKQFAVMAPVANQDGTFSFKKIHQHDEVSLDYKNSLKPPAKEYFVPACEILYSYTTDFKIEPSLNETSKMVFFGIRPCDAHSLQIHDEVWSDGFEDPSYTDKRKNSLFIGLACNEPASTCFCTSFDESGPHSAKGVDILLTTLAKDQWFAESISEKGKEMLGEFGSQPDEKHIDKKNALRNNAINAISRKLNVPEKMGELFNNNYWEKSAMRCLSCGICRYLCPVCYCFSLTDEDGKKIKYCDACSFKTFTKESSGHNPRENKTARYKHWYYHKFDYFKKKTGKFLCVGCGRCIANCPVKIDFTEVLENAVTQ